MAEAKSSGKDDDREDSSWAIRITTERLGVYPRVECEKGFVSATKTRTARYI